MKSYPVDQVPQRGTALVSGTYEAQIESAVPTMSKGNEEMGKKPKAMITLTYRVTRPTSYAFAPIFDNLVIGTEDDPEGEDPAQLATNRAVERWCRLLRMAGLKPSGDFGTDVETLTMGASGQPYSVVVDVRRSARPATNPDGTPNPWAVDRQGRPRFDTDVTGIYAVGERPLIGEDGGAPVSTTTVTKAGGPTITCPTCTLVMPQTEFGKHTMTAHR